LVVGGLGAVLVLLLAFGVYGSVWLTHDRAFSGFGNAIEAPIQLGHTTYAGLGMGPRTASPREVTIGLRSIRPRVELNTADATIELLVCSASQETTRLGVAMDDVSELCSSLAPWHRGSFTFGPFDSDTKYLVLAVTPQRVGEVRIEGADVSFHHGIRRGHQHVGLSMEFHTP
jgi:hypothetical protein